MSDFSGSPHELDKTLHAPARLRLMTFLQQSSLADFQALQQFTGLSSSNLSQHLSKLEEVGYVEVSKRSRGRRAITRISITNEGRSAIDEYWRQLERLREEVKHWSVPETPEEMTGEEESAEEAKGRGSEE